MRKLYYVVEKVVPAPPLLLSPVLPESYLTLCKKFSQVFTKRDTIAFHRTGYRPFPFSFPTLIDR